MSSCTGTTEKAELYRNEETRAGNPPAITSIQRECGRKDGLYAKQEVTQEAMEEDADNSCLWESDFRASPDIPVRL